MPDYTIMTTCYYGFIIDKFLNNGGYHSNDCGILLFQNKAEAWNAFFNCRSILVEVYWRPGLR